VVCVHCEQRSVLKVTIFQNLPVPVLVLLLFFRNRPIESKRVSASCKILTNNNNVKEKVKKYVYR